MRKFIFGVLLIFCAIMLLQRHIVINTTESFPLGVYLKTDGKPRTGDLVLISPPNDPIFREARERTLLSGGWSKAGTCCLIKQLAAVSGDDVLIDDMKMEVNKNVLKNSGRQLNVNLQNNVLLPVKRKLRQGEILLYSPHPRSFDSRYFGMLSEDDIVSRLRPLAVLPWNIKCQSKK